MGVVVGVDVAEVVAVVVAEDVTVVLAALPNPTSSASNVIPSAVTDSPLRPTSLAIAWIVP